MISLHKQTAINTRRAAQDAAMRVLCKKVMVQHFHADSLYVLGLRERQQAYEIIKKEIELTARTTREYEYNVTQAARILQL